MQSLKNLLSNSIKEAGIGRQVQAARAVAYFADIVSQVLGPEYRDQVKALRYRQGVLTITCFSSVLAQEVKLSQGQIIGQLNDKLGGPVVEKLSFLV